MNEVVMTKRQRLQHLRDVAFGAHKFYMEAKNALDAFSRENPDVLAEERQEEIDRMRAEREKKKVNKEQVSDVVWDNVKPHMWVKVKTSRGSEYRYVTATRGQKNEHWDYRNITAARVKGDNLIKRRGKVIGMRNILVTTGNIERQDDYVLTSVIAILVPDENDPTALVEKSIRADIMKG